MSDLSGSADCPELGRPYLRAEDFEWTWNWTQKGLWTFSTTFSQGFPRTLAKWLTRKRERSNDVAGGADVVRPCVGKTTSVFEAKDLSVMIRICPEQGNEGIITAITVVGETVTVYCGERTHGRVQHLGGNVTDITNSFWELALSNASRRMKVPAPSEPSHMAWHWAFQNGQNKPQVAPRGLPFDLGTKSGTNPEIRTNPVRIPTKPDANPTKPKRKTGVEPH